MERLTKRLEDGTALYNHGGCPSNMVTDRMIMERLAAYEDTGLKPEEVAELAKDSGWISVKDRLPEQGQEVLLWEVGTPYDETYKHYSMVVYDPELWQPWLKFVTHWRPLPEPPETNP